MGQTHFEKLKEVLVKARLRVKGVTSDTIFMKCSFREEDVPVLKEWKYDDDAVAWDQKSKEVIRGLVYDICSIALPIVRDAITINYNDNAGITPFFSTHLGLIHLDFFSQLQTILMRVNGIKDLRLSALTELVTSIKYGEKDIIRAKLEAYSSLVEQGPMPIVCLYCGVFA